MTIFCFDAFIQTSGEFQCILYAGFYLKSFTPKTAGVYQPGRIISSIDCIRQVQDLRQVCVPPGRQVANFHVVQFQNLPTRTNFHVILLWQEFLNIRCIHTAKYMIYMIGLKTITPMYRYVQFVITFVKC